MVFDFKPWPEENDLCNILSGIILEIPSALWSFRVTGSKLFLKGRPRYHGGFTCFIDVVDSMGQEKVDIET